MEPFLRVVRHIGRGDVNAATHDRLTVDAMHRGERSCAIEDGGQGTAVIRPRMNDDEDRGETSC